jgi:hypothetical protein
MLLNTSTTDYMFKLMLVMLKKYKISNTIYKIKYLEKIIFNR